MPPRRARVVDPSLLPPPDQQQAQYGAGPHAPAYDPSYGHQQPHGAPYNPYTQQQQQQQLQGQPDYYAQQQQDQAQYGAPSPQHFQPPVLHQQNQQQQPYPDQHIPQPPHSTGASYRGGAAGGVGGSGGARSKIDAESVPSPVAVLASDQELYEGEDGYFLSGENMGVVPLSGTQFRAIDQGNSTPAHIRLTTYNVPASQDLATSSHIPFGVVVQPFARHRSDEHPVPVARFEGGRGPPRCAKCRGYINAWCRFARDGMFWHCNLCGKENSVHSDYYAQTQRDAYGNEVCLDIAERPELTSGTVDLVVPEEYYFLNSPPTTLPELNALPSNPASLSSAAARAKESSTGFLSGVTSGDKDTLDFGVKPEGLIAGLALGEANRKDPRPPVPLRRVFALDVSWNSAKSGLVREWCEGLRRTLFADEEGGEESEEGSSVVVVGGAESEEPTRRKPSRLPPGCKIAIVTFDRSIQFYDFSGGREIAEMLEVGDIDDVFLPLSPDAFFVDPADARQSINTLLSSLPNMFADSPHSDAILGPALQASLLSLSRTGGQINIFQTALPSVGPGALKPRDETKFERTDREKTLFVPQDIWWRNLAEDCVDAGVGVNMFLFPMQYIDVATIGILPAVTGGDLFYMPKFDPVRTGGRLRAALEQVVHRETGTNATMIIRCSTGLRVDEHFGSFLQRGLNDLEFGSVDSDKAIAAYLRHDGSGSLDERRPAAIQAALLYTSQSGERRVRTVNIQVPVTSLIGNVFRFADIDAVTTLLMKEAIDHATVKMLPTVREDLTRRCVKLLASYRRNCALGSPPGQLILPESFKLLPLYTLAMLKSKALKGGNIISDVRVAYMRHQRNLGVAATIQFLYPRMVALHVLRDEDGIPVGDYGRIPTPPLMRCSYSWMEPHGAYLLVNGEVAIIWLGSAVSPQILDDLWGVDDLQNLDVRMSSLPRLPTRLSVQVRNILAHFSELAGRELPVILARQNADGSELDFANMLVEDKNNGELSYPDYLMHCHRKITEEVRGQSEKGDGQGGWNQWFAGGGS